MNQNEQYRDTGKLTNSQYGAAKDTLTKKRNKGTAQNASKK